MALGNLTKQLATQALNDQVNNVLDAFRPGDAAKSGEAVKGDKSPAGGPADTLGVAMVNEIQAMQKALKEDQELAVSVVTGPETLRVLDVYLPGASVLVLTGVDGERNVTRVVAPAAALQLVCKVIKIKPEAKPTRINFHSAKM